MPKNEQPHLEDGYWSAQSAAEFMSIGSCQGDDLRIGVKRPDYLARSEVPPRLRILSPECRIVVVLREPVERAVSAYYHYVRYGLVPDLPLSLGLKLIRLDSLGEFYPRSSEVLTYGEYGRHLARWRSFSRQTKCSCSFRTISFGRQIPP